jgi:molecular chaperone HtpG
MTTSTENSGAETLKFQAEAQQLLHLMIHSLYTNKDVFLRELISNASDALDRLRFESLTRPELCAGESTLEIRIEADPAARTLTIRDNGIGMSRQEIIDNIGTIARSGTRELIQQLRDAETPTELIGQFGVGFYSCFMVADKVELVSRRAGAETATRWESSGDGSYTVADAGDAKRGTSITLHLKAQDAGEGIADYVSEWVIKRIVKRYSDFVTHPIRLRVERQESNEGTDANGSPVLEGSGSDEEARPRTTIRWDTINSMKPIWTRSESELTAADLNQFYKHVSRDWTDPMLHVALHVEGHFEYRALLFVPGHAPHDLYYMGYKPGLQLYARRVQIVEHCEELLPRYLRFLKGVVDAPDLPLNVSRELVQTNRQVSSIRKGLTRKVLDTLSTLKGDDDSLYQKLWREFGRVLKEGTTEDADYRERLLGLLLFESSHDASALTDFEGYVTRMKEGQNDIFYLTGETRDLLEASPHLEAFSARGIEVLFLTDPVDELMVQSVREYKGKRLKCVGKGEIDLGGGADEAPQKDGRLEQRRKELEPLLMTLQKKLEQHVKQVRLSGRLTESPACLVGGEHDYSPHLEKLLRSGKEAGHRQRRILELNPEHAIVAGLLRRHEEAPDDPLIDDYAELLFGYASLAEGAALADPRRFNRGLTAVMNRSLGSNQ